MATRADLPKMRITWTAFKALLEYSRSMPTGQTIGKTWKRATYDRAGNIVRWVICRYEEADEPGYILIKAYNPIIRCKSGEGLPSD